MDFYKNAGKNRLISPSECGRINGMKRFFATILFVPILIMTMILAGCQTSPFVERSYFAMDTVMTVKYAGDESYLAEIGEILSDLDDTLSTTKKTSLISRLNESGDPITDPNVISIVRKSLEYAKKTEGAFDPTVYPLVKLWGFTTDSPAVPTDEEIAAALQKVGYDKIAVSDSVTTTGAQLDLGGIAKGYATEKLKEYLAEKGVKDALINLGGNVYAMGKKNGVDWQIAVKDPLSENYVGVLSLSDRAVVTSGLYERFFEKDGKKYGHILDPKTGKPVENDFLSVTVVGKNATKCDAFSTALFVMGKEKAISFALKNKIDVLFVTTDGIVITANLEKIFTPSSGYASAKKTVIVW